MKILKLDARFHDARRIANCLIGSPCDLLINYRLQGIVKTKIQNGWAFVCYEYEHNSFTLQESIEIPLMPSWIKFCPFVAMRKKVIVKSDYTPCVLNPTTFEVSGLLKKMEFDCGEEHFSIIEDGTIFDMCGFDEISIDLGPIERGELQGCEIVEVE